jgi:mannosyltransferase OCH1-like enzyme
MTVAMPSLTGSPEDDRFRSRFVQSLLHQPQPPAAVATDVSAIPRVIVHYWHDFTDLPDDVRTCLNSWEPLSEQGFTRRLFDDVAARSFIAANFGAAHLQAFYRCYHPAMRCDYFRLCYILRSGGFYVDADEVYQGADWEALFEDARLKVQPLCYDVPSESMIAPKVFWHDTADCSDRIFYVNNNPLIAAPGHPLLLLALERSTRLLLERTDCPEIQSTTGPGNLSASLVRHAITTKLAGGDWDFLLLRDWERISRTAWDLSYRRDARNWRSFCRPRRAGG